MRIFKNQRGYALVIVLLTITIIALFIPPIMSNVMSSALQFQRTGEKLQLTKLEEMGQFYFESALEGATIGAKDSLTQWLDNQPDSIIDDNEAIVDKYKTELESELNSFEPELEIKLNDSRIKIILDSISVENRTISVSYTITPSLDSQYDDSNSLTEEQTIGIELD
ncbi:hypothetical protein [Aquibacillus saliphilus]|uniref:hypothetical protein n=1 Tax=Aquibacillus saliphilus TaxID=1909422 RepID=UPI001CF0A417|nr:hypothetical protein [Aquibacillus saliphilus]